MSSERDCMVGIGCLIALVLGLQLFIHSYAEAQCLSRLPPPVDRTAALPTLHAVLSVRIYDADLPGWRRHELEHWLQYMRYAGVSQVYLYDTRQDEAESLAALAAQYDDYVTYIDWSGHARPFTTLKTQVGAYQHCIKTYGKLSDWQLAFDMDEYPFAENDREQGFLQRAVAAYGDDVTEVSLQNYVYLGKPCYGNRRVIERMTRRTAEPMNDLVKPIYRPYGIYAASLHKNILKCGRQVDAAPISLRFNHYWGLRLQNWGKGCDAGSTRKGKIEVSGGEQALPLPACLLDEQVLGITVEDHGAAYTAKRLDEMHPPA